MRPFPLGPVQAGISRIRQKGGASPDSLYDLSNGWVTADRSVVPRPGTALTSKLPANQTKGLCYFGGKFHVFASSVVAMTDSDFVCHTLPHPTDSTLTLKEIHFAEPFVGYLYVVAEFSDGSVFHYWLQEASTWTANSAYHEGDIVEPTTPNGYVYKASRKGPAPISWAPDVPRAVNDVVTPTTLNGFDYTCILASGDDPKSGKTEPVWPTSDGATVNEDTGPDQPVPPTYGDGGGGGVPGWVSDRYNINPRQRTEEK